MNGWSWVDEMGIHQMAVLAVFSWSTDWKLLYGERPSEEAIKVMYEEYCDELRGFALIEGKPVTPALPPSS